MADEHVSARQRLDDQAFARLVRSVVDYAIFMLDIEGRVVSWNAGAERIKGYSEDEIVGEHFSRFYTDEDKAAGVPARALATARQTGQFSAEGWRRRKDGSLFWASVVIDAIRDDDGRLTGFAKVTRDLTERREAQLELEASREQLAQAQKMEAVGQLTGGVAHDFNNLLTGIAGSLDLLRTRLAQGRYENLEKYVVTAQSAAARAAALTHRLLAFSRRQTLDATTISANALIAGIEELVRRTMGPAIRVESALAPDLWPAFCDPNQLETAILNLCINARDAMPGGGRLTIETGNASIDERAARERDMSPGDYVAICVSDTGSGMSPEVLARAFEPFFTTKPVGQGTGLGLSMIYGFAKQSGGQARIYSEPDAGATVRLYLPRHDGEVVDAPKPERALASTRPGNGEVVLVVDDEPSVRMLVKETLAELGYTAVEAMDAATGARVLRSATPLALLITDIGLPGGVSGRQMVAGARRRRPDLKVLYITGYAENAALETVGSGRLTQVLSKPFAMDTLAARIRAILAVD